MAVSPDCVCTGGIKVMCFAMRMKSAGLLPRTKRQTKCAEVGNGNVSVFLFKVRDVDYSGITDFD